MVRNTRQLVAAMLGLALTAAISFQASAQDDLMPEDAMQQDTMQSEPMSSVAEEYGKGCGKGCGDDGCCGCGSFYGEFQYVNLNQYDSAGNFEDVDSEDGYRVVGGYQGCDGLGLRVRYFDFDGVQDIDDEDIGLELQYLDIEVTDTICICNLHGIVSAGYRRADYLMANDGPESDFEGDGVTVGLVVQREVSCNLALYAWTQHSFLYGDDEEVDDNVVLGWHEIQLGAEYATCVGGYDAFVRGGVEAQQHEGLSDGNGFDTGVFGWFLSAGLNY